MPEIPELDWSKLKPKTPELKSSHGTHTEFDKLRTKSYQRKQQQMIDLEKQRLGEKEYQRKLGLRIRGLI